MKGHLWLLALGFACLSACQMAHREQASMKVGDAFVARWAYQGERPEPTTEKGVASAEVKLGAKFPDSYRAFVKSFGAIESRIELLSHIADEELDFAEIQEFFEPEEVVSTTHDWRGRGLPSEFVAFGSDSMGNLSCFRCVGGACENEVWFFDHDFEEVETTSLGKV